MSTIVQPVAGAFVNHFDNFRHCDRRFGRTEICANNGVKVRLYWEDGGTKYFWQGSTYTTTETYLLLNTFSSESGTIIGQCVIHIADSICIGQDHLQSLGFS